MVSLLPLLWLLLLCTSAIPGFTKICNKDLMTGSVFSPVFKFLCFLSSQLLYECKLFTIAFISSDLSLPQACLKACLSSLFLLFVVGNHRARKDTSLLQASSQSAGKSPVLQVEKLPLMMAANCFTQPSSRLGCLVSFHWQHLLEPLFAVNLAAILLSLFCIPAILCMRCNYVHAMCCLGLSCFE